jgi:hypothetical protein
MRDVQSLVFAYARRLIIFRLKNDQRVHSKLSYLMPVPTTDMLRACWEGFAHVAEARSVGHSYY